MTSDRSAPSTPRRQVLRWLGVSSALAALFIVTSLASRPVVTDAERAAGAPSSTAFESLAFADPVAVADGVAPHGTLAVVVSDLPVTGVRVSVNWLSSAGEETHVARVTGRAGSTRLLALAYGDARTQSWITVSLEGLGVALRVWVS